jgi:hypothetical protein
MCEGRHALMAASTAYTAVFGQDGIIKKPAPEHKALGTDLIIFEIIIGLGKSLWNLKLHIFGSDDKIGIGLCEVAKDEQRKK